MSSLQFSASAACSLFEAIKTLEDSCVINCLDKSIHVKCERCAASGLDTAMHRTKCYKVQASSRFRKHRVEVRSVEITIVQSSACWLQSGLVKNVPFICRRSIWVESILLGPEKCSQHSTLKRTTDSVDPDYQRVQLLRISYYRPDLSRTSGDPILLVRMDLSQLQLGRSRRSDPLQVQQPGPYW